MSLTPRQKDVLDFVVSYQSDKGFSPTYKEIAEGVGVSSVGGVAAHVKKIEARGYIKTLPGNRRMIEVIKTGVLAGALAP
jgi:repressor LexA|tara:strand:- start:188 stop:427 length:240 start_codon:yes stop_codon:yes gene_type:complete